MEKFKVGDYVHASDWCHGQIVELDDECAYVEFNEGVGGGCLPFSLDELVLAKPPKKTVIMKLTEEEFNMLVEKLSWMKCVVKDGNLNYENYCNGECNETCNRKDLCNVETWLKSKIICK